MVHCNEYQMRDDNMAKDPKKYIRRENLQMAIPAVFSMAQDLGLQM